MPETTKTKEKGPRDRVGASAERDTLREWPEGFRFPARIGGVSLALRGEEGETKAKRVFKITLEADEEKLVQGSIPIGRNGVEFAAGEFARLAGQELWVDLVTRQVQLPFATTVAPRAKSRARRKTKATAKGQEVLVP